MDAASSKTLARDCDATQIPSGASVRLPAGTTVDVLQSLGGSFTVQLNGGLFRISAADSEALGIAVTPQSKTHLSSADSSPALTEEGVWSALRTCYDPEIPVNIVDLGLVYDMQIEPIPTGGSRVKVKMTLTAPGCGMGATIAGDAQQKILELPGVSEAEVQIVWDPQWQPSRISPAGRTTLGLDE